LKTNPATASIPVIALTALGTKADLESGRDAGCDAYIVKPLRYRELRAAIDSVLARCENRAAGTADVLHRARSPASSSDTAGAPARSGQAVDLGVLEGLIGNEPAMVLEFLQAFRVGAAAIARELRSACADRRAVQAGRQAHKLKSSAQLAGALTLGSLCAAMEAAGRAGDMAALLPLLPAFERELAAVDACLEAMPAHGPVPE
jgi:HPt (histidine-containing phosphotransfer) domain-containing protein